MQNFDGVTTIATWSGKWELVGLDARIDAYFRYLEILESRFASKWPYEMNRIPLTSSRCRETAKGTSQS